jgi:hypothetical protein
VIKTSPFTPLVTNMWAEIIAEHVPNRADISRGPGGPMGPLGVSLRTPGALSRPSITR